MTNFLKTQRKRRTWAQQRSARTAALASDVRPQCAATRGVAARSSAESASAATSTTLSACAVYFAAPSAAVLRRHSTRRSAVLAVSSARRRGARAHASPSSSHTSGT